MPNIKVADSNGLRTIFNTGFNKILGLNFRALQTVILVWNFVHLSMNDDEINILVSFSLLEGSTRSELLKS